MPFTTKELTDNFRHIHCFIAAKKLAQTMGKDEELLFAKKQSDDGTETIFMCPATYHDSVKVCHVR